jgi:drug/metabolite transporter (DMT)-like permease
LQSTKGGVSGMALAQDGLHAPVVVPAGDESAANRRQILWLALWMTGSLLSFSIAAVSVRALAKSLSAFEIMSIRSASGLLFLTLLAVLQPELRKTLAPRRMGLHALRNSIHFGSQISWTLAVTWLPLATVFALEFTMPAWVALLAVAVLGERLTRSRIGSIALCFLGVLLIVRPGHGDFRPEVLVALAAAVLMAITLTITKKLTATESTFAILFWMNLMQLPMNLAGSDLAFVLRLEPSMALPMVGIAIAGLTTHYCLTNAFRHGDASVVIPLDFLRVPFIAFVGWFLYAEPLQSVVFAGAALIIAGVFWNLRAESLRVSPPSP